MIMTLSDYLYNPQGRGSVSPGLRKLKEEYDAKYETLLAIHNEFDVNIYSAGTDQYYIHVRVPSSSYDGVLYDAVIHFTRLRASSSTNIKDWSFQAILNSPSFVFTYANVFKRNKLIIEDLKFVVDKTAYSNPPKMRNPYSLLGPEKILYIALKYIEDHYLETNALQSLASKFNMSQLKKELVDINTIMSEIHTIEEKISLDKKKERSEQKKLDIQKRHDNMMSERNNKLYDNQQNNSNISKHKTIRTIVKIKPIKKR